MRRFGLIGFPLGHSFSKNYFSEKFRKENLFGCSYENYPLKQIDDLPGLLECEQGLEGLNVTIPYKSVVMKFLDSVSAEAREIGAVNVIRIVSSEGRRMLNGFNSDAYGFTESLRPNLSKTGGKALVLGTGGSSKAVVYSLRKLGMQVTLVSRTRNPGVITWTDINSDLLKNTDLIVNTTPLGMFPDIEGKPDLDYSCLSEKHILFDLVYNPVLTAFLKEGKERGCTVIGGLEMLHLQAERSWEIWNGR